MTTDPSASLKPNGGFVSFLSRNSWIGAISSIAGIIGVPLSIILFAAGKEYPDLTYSVNPARTVVVKRGQSSALTILYNDKQIDADISAVQVAIWNDGKTPIHDLLTPLVISTAGGTPILEATITKPGRDVIKLNVDDTARAQGKVAVSWRVLERNDGGVIQLIYAGSPDLLISAEAALIGQGSINGSQSPAP